MASAEKETVESVQSLTLAQADSWLMLVLLPEQMIRLA